MIDNDIMREHRERIEIHKQKYLDGNYNKSIDTEDKGAFGLQTIICFFIFATLIVLKFTDSNFTSNIITSLDTSLSKDNLPYIITVVENVGEYDFGLNKLKTEAEALEVDAQNLSNQNIDPQIPATEFTIDENMLNDINNTELVGKK